MLCFAYMDYPSRIICDPTILVGKPTIRGTRISVELILNLLATGMSYPEILEEYPDLSTEDILAAISYARDSVTMEEIRHFDMLPERL